MKIWEPKYSNDTVRVDVRKTDAGDNTVVFTKSPSSRVGIVYTFDRDRAMQLPKIKNGRGWVYEVPMSWLKEKDPRDKGHYKYAPPSQNPTLF